MQNLTFKNNNNCKGRKFPTPQKDIRWNYYNLIQNFIFNSKS